MAAISGINCHLADLEQFRDKEQEQTKIFAEKCLRDTIQKNEILPSPAAYLIFMNQLVWDKISEHAGRALGAISISSSIGSGASHERARHDAHVLVS